MILGGGQDFGEVSGSGGFFVCVLGSGVEFLYFGIFGGTLGSRGLGVWRFTIVE